MTNYTALPGLTAPPLRVHCLDGSHFDLAKMHPEKFTLVIFYRGVHCPLCRDRLEEVDRRLDEVTRRGITVLAVSMDSRERAMRQAAEWKIGKLTIGYALSEADARAWGLFISRKEKDAEPARFSEPGTAIVYPDGRLYAIFHQSVPFAAPRLDDILYGLDYIVKHAYPARGTLAE